MIRGTRLSTRDGRKIGNAILLKPALYDSGGLIQYNLIKTDFGNTAKFTDGELKEFFWTEENITYRYSTSVKEWMLNKIKLLFKGII